MKYIPSIKRSALLGLAFAVLATAGISGLARVWSEEPTPYTIEHRIRLVGQGAQDWKQSLSVRPSDKLEWTIKFRNIDTQQLQNIAVTDDLAKGVTIVPGSIMMYDGNYPNGYTIPDSAIQADGRKWSFNIGNHNPLAQADRDSGKLSVQIIFSTTVDALAKDACGVTTIASKATLTPQDRQAISDNAQAVVDTGLACEQPKPTPTPPTNEQPNDEQPASTFACTLNVEPVAGKPRTIRAGVAATATPAVNVKSYIYDFGDEQEPLLTDQAVREYTYSQDGTYTVRVKATFAVNGEDKVVEDERCVKSVVVATPPAPVAPASPATPAAPAQLPSTGVGNIAAVFVATTIGGAMAYRVFLLRRLGN